MGDQAEIANWLSLASLGAQGLSMYPKLKELFGAGAEAGAAADVVSPPSLSATASAAPAATGALAAGVPATQSIGSLAEVAGGMEGYHAALGGAGAAAGGAGMTAGVGGSLAGSGLAGSGVGTGGMYGSAETLGTAGGAAGGTGFLAGLAPVAPIGAGILGGFAVAHALGFGDDSGGWGARFPKYAPEKQIGELQKYYDKGEDIFYRYAQWIPEMPHLQTKAAELYGITPEEAVTRAQAGFAQRQADARAWHEEQELIAEKWRLEGGGP
jgi:hypothetical protein